ncbi:DNA glycosylase [Russula ochroleuca]|jgi:methyl-CpG-binding domain protein 4|uniref:DNA glycosylase n=1 Tax=Russula ochroleuca TaxID=152965 RepID=A0A9P5MQI9_9AGAM|nr:DNA glycosylase [Russula ochroleuca]
MSVSERSSTFFPPPYRPDLDGPPLSILDIAKQKLLSVTQDCSPPDPAIHIQEHLNLLTDSPGYAAFFLTSLERYERLLNAKPVLIQERVADDPWKLLVAVTLLNKTSGRSAVPIFWTLINRWLTPESLAKADPAELRDHIRPLGLQSIRARRLIALSAAYTYSCVYDDDDHDHDHDHTPISHLPGSGPYALDSYRIYCGGPDAWRTVMPRDKELIRFIKWRWAAHGVQWSPTFGVMGPASETYIEQLIHELVALDPYAPR